jgi:acyl-coenzyme A thioesterase PaaI-like protein
MTVSSRTSLAKRMVGAAIVTGGIVFALLPSTAQAVSLATTSGAVAPHGLVQKARVTINVNTRRANRHRNHWNRRHHHCWWNGRRRVCGWR